MSAILGMPAVQILTACQLFVASAPAVGWHPHWGEENYIFLQNSRQVVQQANDVRYCSEFSPTLFGIGRTSGWALPDPFLPGLFFVGNSRLKPSLTKADH
jgi:hypothetical protein